LRDLRHSGDARGRIATAVGCRRYRGPGGKLMPDDLAARGF
jgi:hypothetical protein